MKKPLLGLVMIVKDEADNIGRCLSLVKPLIDTWTICDTGSSDDTRKIIRRELKDIPGRLYRHKWHDFGTNRTMALARAKGTARWLLMIDADEDVNYLPDFLEWLNQQSREVAAYQLEVLDHGITYRVPYLVRGDLDWRYVGTTHEYLDPAGRRQRPLNGLVVIHMGERTPEQAQAKLLRDIELLKPAFRKQDPRAIFYTAECRRYLGQDEHAAKLYDLRASLDGFEEERWYASYQAAALRRDVEGLIEAWRQRPWRCEPFAAAARIVFAESRGGAGDVLFLERPVVEIG